MNTNTSGARKVYIGVGRVVHFAVDSTTVLCGRKGGAHTPAKGPHTKVTCQRCSAKLTAYFDQLAAEYREAQAVSEAPAPTRRDTRAQRRAARRQANATLRAQAPTTRAAERARRCQRQGLPQTARTLLTAAGVPDQMAARYAPAFSRDMAADAQRSRRIRKGKRDTTFRTDVKLYCLPTFRARLAEYRPGDRKAAAVFAQASL